jgi:hypothetical protein
MSTDFKNLLKRSFETVTLNHCPRIPPLGITGFKFKECELEVSRIEPLHNANCVVEYLSRNLLTALMHQSMIRSFVESLFCCCDRPLRFLSLAYPLVPLHCSILCTGPISPTYLFIFPCEYISLVI